MNAKTCKQCGELKPIDQFRKYYGGRTGTYTTCKQCEKINSRLKYLESKDQLAELEVIEREKIYKLYDVQRAAGLQPPRRGGRSTQLTEDLDSMIDKYAPIVVANVTQPAPPDLAQWLTCELTEDPDYYLDTLYETLCNKFRPVEYVDKSTMMPVYDETYKPVLDSILQRFYDYEDKYYEDKYYEEDK